MRTRLSTEQRREQLLTIGVELFARQPYDEVHIEEVAQIAQVSRGLLYHYFPTKREFFLAIVRTESARLLRLSAQDPSRPLSDQLNDGLDVYLDYAQRHASGYRIVHLAANAADEEIRVIRDAALTANRDRILGALGAVVTVDESARLAVRAWLMFVTALVLDWLDNPVIPRAELRDLCTRTLFAAIGLPAANQDS